MALLRVLQEREFERVGGTQPIKVDVPIICATHRDLEKMVRAGEFREDLFDRLRCVTIEMPALRSRVEDMPAVTERLLSRIASERNEAPKILSKLPPHSRGTRERGSPTRRNHLARFLAATAAHLQLVDNGVLPLSFRSPRRGFLRCGSILDGAGDESLGSALVSTVKRLLAGICGLCMWLLFVASGLHAAPTMLLDEAHAEAHVGRPRGDMLVSQHPKSKANIETGMPCESSDEDDDSQKSDGDVGERSVDVPNVRVCAIETAHLCEHVVGSRASALLSVEAARAPPRC